MTVQQQQGQPNHGPFSLEQVLREEAEAIHGKDKVERTWAEIAATVPSAATSQNGHLPPQTLYRTLNALNSAALCLSGGGIRSASFALGVIQALAMHPRPVHDDKNFQVDRGRAGPSAQDSLLAKFHYLSTVSGGGYIGGWLSAWVHREGFDKVWRGLIGRNSCPDMEAGPIAWLRAYSNYLTPKLGLMSADTWAAIALFVRNMILNWLVIIPAVCLILLLVQIGAVAAFNVSVMAGQSFWPAGLAFAIWAVFLILALAFALVSRPTSVERQPAKNVRQRRLHDESSQTQQGPTQFGFLACDLAPGLLSALAFSLGIGFVGIEALSWQLHELARAGAAVGSAAYAMAWFVAWYWIRHADRSRWEAFREFLSFAASGALYGAAIALGVFLFSLEPVVDFRTSDDVPAAIDVLILLICGVPWIVTAQLIAEMVFVGLTSWQKNSDSDREWFGRSTGWYASAAIVGIVIAFLVLVGPDFVVYMLNWADSQWSKWAAAIVGPVSGIIAAWMGQSSASPAKSEAKSWTGLIYNIALAVVIPIFLVFLIIALAWTLDLLLLGNTLLASALMNDGRAEEQANEWTWLLIGLAVVTFVGLVASWRVNINRFSLHALYRNRLVRAYLGASHRPRKPNPFTGFDEDDNLNMAQLKPKNGDGWRPFHIVNIALNLVSSTKLAWQERKAATFTVSPLHCGTALDVTVPAFRRSDRYGHLAEGISLGTAVAISGAAASPNMGYHSSPMVTLLLALFNVRLGWWLGNPGAHGEATYHDEGPQWALLPFVNEMFGRTTDERRYVYLSDGGHFENLGLYEMVRRRCRLIVVSDAGCDPKFGFEDLGNAVRKIAIDLGVTVRLRKLDLLKPRPAAGQPDLGDGHPYCAVGDIDYCQADGGGSNGVLIYIKPGYHGIESAAVRAYALANLAFPHQSTGDQFYSESQLESYRTLGFEIADTLLSDALSGANRPKTWTVAEIAGALGR